jgi:hypothetical protein
LRKQEQIQSTQTASLERGAHSIRVGSDYRHLIPSRRDAAASFSVFADSIDSLLLNQIWRADGVARHTVTRLDEYSMFLQDTWHMSRRLTMSYGLRWEFSPPPDTLDPAYFGVSGGGFQQDTRPIWRTRYNNFAPRLGFAYRPWKSDRIVFRAGAGLFYDSSLSLATDLVNGGPFDLQEYRNNVQAPFLTQLTYGFAPDLRLPRIIQWNVALESALSKSDVLSVGYVGSTGRDLVRRELATTDRFWVALATNNGSSDYNGLQVQYRRSLAHGFQARLSYTWSHSIDNSSSDSALHWVGAGSSPSTDVGASDFDVRHAFHAAVTYEVPSTLRTSRVLRGWAMDGIFHARSGFPISVLNSDQYTGLNFANIFRPDRVPGVALWLNDVNAPGGKRLNPDAFRSAGTAKQGNLGRNAISGFGMSQVDLALRREFKFGDTRSFQIRMEAFNALNHPNFADPQRFLVSPLFGRSTSMLNLMLGTGTPGSGLAPIFQSGGARSAQIALRFRF